MTFRAGRVGYAALRRSTDGGTPMTDPHVSTRPTDERLADSDVEGLIDEASDVEIPDEERVVPEDVNEHVPDDPADYY
jgi:hypothetical protein